MAELLHLAERDHWEVARRHGAYERSTRGRTLQEEGFIHCSTADQLPAVAAALYGDADPDTLLVLVIDSRRLSAPVRYEAAEPGGERYPHVYGPLPVDAVVRVEAWAG